MKFRFAAGVLAVSGLLLLPPVGAQAQEHQVAVKAGLLGLGIEYAFSPTDFISVRLGLNGSKFGFDAEESGIDYEFDFVWDSQSAAVDVHPFRGAWRVTAGLLRNDNHLKALGRSANSITIGETTYSSDEIGRLTGRVEFDSTAPFVSVGWDWSRQKRFGLSFDIGVVKQGTPQVTLAASGPIAEQPVFQQNLALEREELQDALDDFDLLPFATLGLVVRF